MTQVFGPTGEAIPVTVIEAGPCVVTQIRTLERDGYEAVQIGFGDIKPKSLTKPQQGHLAKAGRLVRYLREFEADDAEQHEVGHGQSDRARAPGSIGAGTTPGRVWKGTRMAGRMGNKRVTIQNLEVVEVLPEQHVILVRGSVPGAKNGLLMIRQAVKAAK
jgi:large subunit ribosomal protein L3